MQLKKVISGIVCACFLMANKVNAQLLPFDQSKINNIYIAIPPDSLTEVLQHNNNNYYHASFKYTNGIDSLLADTIGFRIRGNTSLQSKKKSFKISFDAFDSTAKYMGLRKLNLIGNHNDPTMVREKLFYECWNKAGFAKRQVSFINLYINNVLYGVYSNAEEIDKIWLKKSFGNSAGNLYKCSWGADLKFKSNNPNDYKTIGGNNTRTYDLQTNETADNYTDLALLIEQINKPFNSNYVSNLEQYFHVNDYLKALALDVATGNWDSYAYNMNNYFLYNDTLTKKFRFITFDTDNTFGVDWLVVDWATRSAINWHHPTQSRLLASNLLKDASAKQIFLQNLQNITQQITKPDSIFSRIDSLRNMLIPYVGADTFRSLDYGYDFTDFMNGFNSTVDSHTPYGIKPFLTKRAQYLSPLFINDYLSTKQIDFYPNPVINLLNIQVPENLKNAQLEIFNVQGNILQTQQLEHISNTIDVSKLPAGSYFLQISQAGSAPISVQIIKQ
jgi:hypothetical protein